MAFWADKRVLVTGGTGFLGGFLVEKLGERAPARLVAPTSSEYDLRDPVQTARCLQDARPDVVIHTAGIVGGIGANLASPGRLFYENAVMGIHLVEQARLAGVGKIVVVGTVCSYPKFAPVPFREADLWNGYPEETNAPYGLAKKMLLVQLQAYRSEYGTRGAYLLLVNLYGPRDNFDLETSHVIPAMIVKFAKAKRAAEAEVVLWGDGTATREFLYVEDAAEGILRAAELYDGADPINLGSGQEISIRDLASRVAAEVGYPGRILWDASKPNGQPRRRLDVSRAKELLGWTATTPFAEGLARTVAWYRDRIERTV